jgi:hypothetical protein
VCDTIDKKWFQENERVFSKGARWETSLGEDSIFAIPGLI